MQTSTQALPTRSSVTARTKVVDVTVVERDFGIDGSTEVDINNGQAAIEIMEDGRILFSAYGGALNAVVVEYESLEDFIESCLGRGDIA